MTPPEESVSAPGSPGPSYEEKRSWWRRIYFGLGVGFPCVLGLSNLLAFSGGGAGFGVFIAGIGMVALWAIMLPIGLAADLGCLVAAITEGQWHPMRNTAETFAMFITPIAYGIFALHWRLTVNARTYRVFWWLMFSLGLLVIASLIGCAQETSQPLGLQ